jgi:uncharacterized protein
MRISRVKFLAPALLAMLAFSGGGAGAADQPAESAYRSSVRAMKAHDFDRAIPDLKRAADGGVFLAQYYLARIYAIDGQPFTNHRQAFERLRALVAANRGVDPYLDKRAPFIANAERLLALYYREGVPGFQLPDAGLAKAHLEHAALRLGDTEAQFQLAVMELDSPDFQPRALDTLDMLAQTKHHAGAAAQIAIVYSKDKQAGAIPFEALAYATYAVKIAGESDRVWIGDIYQTLYCAASTDGRSRAANLANELESGALNVTDGDRQPPELGRDRQRVLGVLDLGGAGTERLCGNGEAVPDLKHTVAPQSGQPSVIAKGFNSPVGFIAPPMGAGLRDLETPSLGDEHGEPLGGADEQPTQ